MPARGIRRKSAPWVTGAITVVGWVAGIAAVAGQAAVLAVLLVPKPNTLVIQP